MLRLTPVSDPEIMDEQFMSQISQEIISSGSAPKDMSLYKISRANNHMRPVIKLALPCVNTVLCGTNYNRAAKLLGVSAKDFADLVEFQAYYDRDAKAIIKYGKDEIFDTCTNGLAVNSLIDDMGIEETIKAVIEDVIKKPMQDIPYTLQKQGDFRVYGDWYVALDNPDDAVKLSEERLYKTVSQSLNKLTQASMLMNLLNMFGDEHGVKEYLKSVMNYNALPVLPVNLRPGIDKRRHPNTTGYIRLYNRNNDYSTWADSPADKFVAQYKELFRHLDRIVCGKTKASEFVKGSDMTKVRPILQITNGKKGFVRDQMLSKRQDYSGRAAVVVDPFQPIDTLGVPESIISREFKLYAVRSPKLTGYDVMSNMSSSSFDLKIADTLTGEKLFDDVPIMMGRNPTLHKHGIQAFNVMPVKGRALRVSPLVCPAYNMDFDGDSAHTEVPIGPKAAWEVKHLMLTDRNILLPKTSESTISPRMDIIYGLYMCTRDKYVEGSSIKSYKTAKELKEDIYALKIFAWDTVTLSGLGTGIAGKLAFLSCLPKAVANKLKCDKEITTDTIKKYVNAMLKYIGPTFDNTINQLVELGFKTAYLYGQEVSMLADHSERTEEVTKFDSAYEDFYERMRQIDELNDYGLYDAETYGVEYGTMLDKANDALKKGVYAKVGDNMFTAMAKSGARGNKSNLIQIYGGKGRIQKSERDSFNVVLEHSLRDQLPPLEHMIAAHGARRGQNAKSIKTADTGYLTRKLVHIAASAVIKHEDCGTTDGIEIRMKDIRQYFYKEDANETEKAEAYSESVKAMKRFVIGRNTVEGVHVDEAYVDKILEKEKNPIIKIRSPLTCKQPFCKKCYGDDPSTRSEVRLGTPIGIMAAHSLSEPSTQLTMKVFQKGGVQGSATSSFDRLEAVIQQTDICGRAAKGMYMTYDPVAWADGTLRKEVSNSGMVILRIVPDHEVSKQELALYKKAVTVPGGVSYKTETHVKRGETLRITKGDVYTPEMEKICGVDEAALSLVHSIYFLFRPDCDVIPVHVETIVSMLIGYQPVVTDVKELKLGMYYTREQLEALGKDYSNTIFHKHVRGTMSALKENVNFLEALAMEDQRSALSRAALNGLVDLGDSPLIQNMFGWYAEIGTRINPTYAQELEDGRW